MKINLPHPLPPSKIGNKYYHAFFWEFHNKKTDKEFLNSTSLEDLEISFGFLDTENTITDLPLPRIEELVEKLLYICEKLKEMNKVKS